jgi:hypothetical protein
MAFCLRLHPFAFDPPTLRTRLLGRPFSPAMGDAIVINESQHPHYSREVFLSSLKRRHRYEATHGFATIRILVGVFGGRADLSSTGSGVMGEQGIHINGVCGVFIWHGDLLRLSSGYFSLCFWSWLAGRRMGEWERVARLCGLFFPGFFSAALRGA